MIKDSLYWADQKAKEIIEKRRKKQYVCASGVSPSGVVHIGNLREVMVTHFVSESIKDYSKNSKHIHSWDDYDRFRKVPAGVPKHYENYVGMALSEIPDPFGCHDSYAVHFEKEFEESIEKLNLKIEFHSQYKMYRSCVYSESIKKVMNSRKEVAEILDKYRKEPLPADWYPVQIYCERCKKDTTKVVEYDENYKIKYKCQCNYENEFDFRKTGIVKLRWKADWPMRWDYNKVDFEPGGTEHSTAGSSRD
ncbi:MAG: lysine--tRNA ligase, partial [Candidatus Omnitrophica bacterium]|nr:lysine--tRNA ligase [Candidatus Omnitrophota bacterium]